ncbi:Hypothetical protein NTJ_11179 [Nesidiocoris tenuis]|uniref:Uncharacterized protein n=1 Tax=Nesidiocoris tenuis TaxID=355587 RepID=A0ABN7B1R5_9HEMI|nr:Hypothetical protein NTJ_11179 [Nesidiocoris tenuis]
MRFFLIFLNGCIKRFRIAGLLTVEDFVDKLCDTEYNDFDLALRGFLLMLIILPIFVLNRIFLEAGRLTS